MTKTEIDPDPDAVTQAIDAMPPHRAAEARTLSDLMQRITGASPRLWGGRMIGFGQYNYTYRSGHSGTWFLTGFAAAKARLSIYVMAGFDEMTEWLAQLGPHKTSVSCLYVTRLDRVDLDILDAILSRSVAIMRHRYPSAMEA
ncbi:MAG: DUF1801 domain-containing protein [Pseudomonadota bacterium]